GVEGVAASMWFATVGASSPGCELAAGGDSVAQDVDGLVVSGPSRSTVAGRAYLDLRSLAARQDRSTDEYLALYAVEGFLDRLSVSVRADDLALKGGALLAAFDTRRPTRDVALQASVTSNDTDTVLALVREIAALERPDGLAYDTTAATARTIRDE